jgi:hypothetical protein
MTDVEREALEAIAAALQTEAGFCDSSHAAAIRCIIATRDPGTSQRAGRNADAAETTPATALAKPSASSPAPAVEVDLTEAPESKADFAGASVPSGTVAMEAPMPTSGAEQDRVAVCLRCSRRHDAHPHAKTPECPGFVDDAAAPCLACGRRYDEHRPMTERCPVEWSPHTFQAPPAYYCETRSCSWRGYDKPCERRCPACGATVWKDGAAGHKPRPSLTRDPRTVPAAGIAADATAPTPAAAPAKSNASGSEERR